MTAIAFDLPEDVDQIRDGIRAFAKTEVISRHADNQAPTEEVWRKGRVHVDERT